MKKDLDNHKILWYTFIRCGYGRGIIVTKKVIGKLIVSAFRQHVDNDETCAPTCGGEEDGTWSQVQRKATQVVQRGFCSVARGAPRGVW
jgi:hypothetical protein